MGSERNFRSHYYEKMGFRGVEEKKSLDILLRDTPVDLDRIHNFCLRWLRTCSDWELTWSVRVKVPPARHLQGPGVAVAAGGEACPHQQHGVRAETETGAVHGVGDGSHNHREDWPEHRHSPQDNSGLAPGEELLKSKNHFIIFLVWHKNVYFTTSTKHDPLLHNDPIRVVSSW